MNESTATVTDLPSSATDEAEKTYYRVMIRAPIDRVWAELTRTDAVLPFFFNGVCRTPGLCVDAPIRMRTKNDTFTSVVGRVLEFEPPYRYAHTFRFTAYDDPECVVRYVLKETDGGTEFTLINENVPPGTKTEKYMTQGGGFITKNLKSIVETGKPTPLGRFALVMMDLFAPLTPRRCRSEHWPL